MENSWRSVVCSMQNVKPSFCTRHVQYRTKADPFLGLRYSIKAFVNVLMSTLIGL